ncbi:porin family protein [Pontibacter anaerobius]|uniref:Porin family protein n=1 Tax=Pontibacter anaerobius TaxID=2993940 RepID=A0ABT3RAS4_9BACT|nr:porin family protein [Pontibacter anaerobius]MCX2738531.1 porin family protein [Pontibacter anaerobius]
MNKFLIVLGAMFALGSTVSFAQSNNLSIGIEGGVNHSSLRGNDHDSQLVRDPGIGFTAGVSFTYGITDALSLHSGLLYERKSTRFKLHYVDPTGTTPSTTKAHSNFDYLVLPVLARVTYGNKAKFYINAGPYLGYLIQQVDKAKAVSSTTFSNIEHYNRLDLGLTAGLGAGMPINNNSMLTLELRQNLGLYNISKASESVNSDMKTRSTNLLLGIAYTIKNQ